MHVDDGVGLLAGPEERVPVVIGIVDRGESEERRDLAEADRPHPALGIASHLGRGQLATNGELVTRARAILENMGSRILGPAEVREKLKLKKRW